MAFDNPDLQERYRQALLAYLDRGDGEAELATALELGRVALAEGWGVVKLLAIHHSVMQSLIAGLPGDAALARMARANEFLAQSAAPFEMAQRGWRDMIDRLQRVNETLERQVAERTLALRESEQRFRDIAEVGSDWIWDADAQHRFTTFIGQGLYSTGPPEGFLGKTSWETAQADPAADENWARHKADLDAHRPFRAFRYSAPTPAGTRLYLALSGKPVFDREGNFRGYRGTATDETVLIEARRRTEHAEMILRDGLDSVPGGFVIYDDQDRVVMINKTYPRYYPEDADQIVRDVGFGEMLWEGLAGGRYPDGKARADWLPAQLRDRREPHDAIEQRLSDGRWVLDSKHRMRNGWSVGLRIDISPLKAAEAALLESEQMARGIIQTALDAFVQMDEDGNVTEWNPQAEAIFGWAREEVMRRALGDLILPGVPEKSRLQRLARSLTGGEQASSGRRFEVDAVRRGGQQIRVEMAVTALRRGEGYLFNGFIRDLTQKIATEAQLRQAQKMEAIGNLTGGMAHDFNNLLGVIIGNLDMLRDLRQENAAADELARDALEAAWRGADLSRRLLAFARRQPLQPQRLDVNALVSGITKLLSRVLGENIEISLNLAGDLWPIVADPAQLEASLTNLATNARDAMANGGRLLIVTDNRVLDADYAAQQPEVTLGDHVMIAVSDTGIGMTPEVVNRIFEPFFTTKEEGKGSGLGLSMVFGFVKQSGGHISVYSELGLGTTFRLFFPRARDPEARVTAKSEPTRVERSRGETVLAVEDNAALRRVVVRQLAELGYQVLEAENAAVALQRIEQHRVDLLLTDIIMPGGTDGFELAALVRQRWPGIKVVFTSGFPRLNGDDASQTHGSVLLNKPYRKQDLASAIRDALDSDG